MKKVADKNELIHILDENGVETNKLEDRKFVHEKGLWHNEVACIVINKKKQVLLQRRSKNKKSYPNCWALCAGHVVAYEDIKEAIIKEMREELVSEIKGDNIFLLVSKTKNEIITATIFFYPICSNIRLYSSIIVCTFKTINFKVQRTAYSKPIILSSDIKFPISSR